MSNTLSNSVADLDSDFTSTISATLETSTQTVEQQNSVPPKAPADSGSTNTEPPIVADNSTSSGSAENMEPADTIPPPAMTTYTALPGTNQSEVDIDLILPSDTQDYHKILLFRSLAGTPPVDDCLMTSGFVAEFQDFSSASLQFIDNSGAQHGEQHYYRVCIFDSAANLNADLVFDTLARDSLAPNVVQGLSATTGANHAEIDLAWNYDSDLQGLAHLELRYLPGSLPPNADCSKDGTIANLTHTPAASVSAVETLTLGSSGGETFSFRLCLWDNVGNLSSQAMAINIISKDSLAPNDLANFNVLTGTNHGEISLSWLYPNDITDLYRLEVYRSPGSAIPPAAVCTDSSQPVATVLSFSASSAEFLYDQTGSFIGEEFSYRLCVEDNFGNINSNLGAANIKASDTVSPPQVTSFIGTTGSSGGSIDLSLSFPSDESDIDYVKLYQEAGPNPPACGSGTFVHQFDPPLSATNSYVVAGLSSNTQYSFSMCAYDTTGNISSPSSTTATSGTSHYQAYNCYQSNGVNTNGGCQIGAVVFGPHYLSPANHSTATNNCLNFSGGNYTDWRLPNLADLDVIEGYNSSLTPGDPFDYFPYPESFMEDANLYRRVWTSQLGTLSRYYAQRIGSTSTTQSSTSTSYPYICVRSP